MACYAPLGERQVGAAGVLPGDRPLGGAMAHQQDERGQRRMWHGTQG